MTNNNNQEKTLEIPKDTTLPFFAYGIYKPGQLSYSKIKNCVKTQYKCEINYKMLMRDGMPLVIPAGRDHDARTRGHLIYFYELCSESDYEIISKNMHKKMYKWKVIKVGENRANVLIGVNPDMGCSKIDGNIGNYKGQYDPYFKEAIGVIKNELNDEKNKHSNYDNFFKLQMTYLLLWTAIERYASLKYNCSTIGQNWEMLSNEDAFHKSLKKHVKSERKVYSAKDLREFTLDSNKPRYCLNYYYTIRCNATHRGKSAPNEDYEILKQSLEELLLIFEDIINDTFDET